ncbi:hypothetical protein ABIB34_004247 [Rhodococcus sp. UYP5]
MPSGSFGANSTWVQCAAIAHNLLRAAGTVAGGRRAKARGMTLRRKSSTFPPASCGHNAYPHCVYRASGRGSMRGFNYDATLLGSVHPILPEPDRHADSAHATTIVETLGRPAGDTRPKNPDPTIRTSTTVHNLSRWIEA